MDDAMGIVFGHIFKGQLPSYYQRSPWTNLDEQGDHSFYIEQPLKHMVKAALINRKAHAAFEKFILNFLAKQCARAFQHAVSLAFDMCTFHDFSGPPTDICQAQFNLYFKNQFVLGVCTTRRPTSVEDVYELVVQPNFFDEDHPEWDEAAPERVSVVSPILLLLPEFRTPEQVKTLRAWHADEKRAIGMWLEEQHAANSEQQYGDSAV